MEKNCAVCGKKLDSNEIRINERRLRDTRSKKYLCSICRKKDYDRYVQSITKLIKKE